MKINRNGHHLLIYVCSYCNIIFVNKKPVSVRRNQNLGSLPILGAIEFKFCLISKIIYIKLVEIYNHNEIITYKLY